MADMLKNARFIAEADLAAVATGDQLLGQGANGTAVLAVQTALRDMGFNLQTYLVGGVARGGPDGAFGPQTATALANFQRHAMRFHPTVIDNGRLDAATLFALDALAPPPDQTAWTAATPVRWPGRYWQGNVEKALHIVVVLQEHRTFLFGRDGNPQAIFPNSSGRLGSETHHGLKKVVGKLDQADAAAVGIAKWDDPNAFGVRILNLSWADGRGSGEELHGTGHPEQLGMNVSHGCMRHYNQDIITLFNNTRIGDLVAVVEWIDDPALEATPTVRKPPGIA